MKQSPNREGDGFASLSMTNIDRIYKMNTIGFIEGI